MRNDKNAVEVRRKQWVEPVVRRLAAGSAETGTRFNEDNNPDTFNARS